MDTEVSGDFREEILENGESGYDTHIKKHQAIATEVYDINQLVKVEKVDVQEDLLENDEPCCETTDAHIKVENDEGNGFFNLQKTSTVNQTTDTEVHDINQLVKFENIDNSNFSETTDNFHGPGSRNIKHNGVVDKERLDNLHPQMEENSNIYIFENTDLNCQAKDNVGQDLLVEIINIKQEIKDTEEKILEDYSHGYVKYNSVKDTERSGMTGNNDLYQESDKVDVEKNCAYAKFGDLKSLNRLTSNEKSEERLDKRSHSFLDSSSAASDDTNDTISELNTEDISSVIVKENSKNENNVLNIDNSDMNSVSYLNIKKCVSGAETTDFDNCTIVSKPDLVDSVVSAKHGGNHQNNSLFNRPLGTILNPRSQLNNATQKDFCHPNSTVPCISQISEQHITSDYYYPEISNKLTEHVNIKPDKSSKDFILLRKDHVINVNGNPLACIMCGKEVRTLNALLKHICIIPHSTTMTERPHQCSVCGRDFKYFADLRKHIIRHSRERTHHCNVCGKKFKTLSEVKTHMISHSTHRPHQCNMCDKEFKILKDLKTHMISHSTERPHLCNICDKDFKCAKSLKQHMISHRTERPHQCNICSKEFKTTYALKRHMISHSIGRPHQCNVCDKGFKTLDILRKHMLRHSINRPQQCILNSLDGKSL